MPSRSLSPPIRWRWQLPKSARWPSAASPCRSIPLGARANGTQSTGPQSTGPQIPMAQQLVQTSNLAVWFTQFVTKMPDAASGKTEFPWHQDNGYTFVEPQQYLTLWLPLVDVDEANGCPWIAPGLHRLGTLEHWATPIGLKCLEAAPDAVPVPARAGDAIVFSSLTPHRTGPAVERFGGRAGSPSKGKWHSLTHP